MVEDKDLLEKWRAGDDSAGSALLERHYRSLYYFFANKVDGDIDDLVQNTLLACVKSRERFRGQSSFRTYLFTIARHELYGYLRRRKKSRDRLDYSVSSLMDLGITPRSRLARNQKYHLLLRALRSLPVEQQVLLELRYWEDMGIPELADVFAIAEDATYARLSRARKSLRTHLAQLLDKTPQGFEQLDDLDSWARSVRDDRPRALQPGASHSGASGPGAS